VKRSGVGCVDVHATYHLLGLRTYFTAGEKEVRAWTIHAGDTAPKAAGVIHSDFGAWLYQSRNRRLRRFDQVRLRCCRARKGLYRMEGKE